MFKKNLLFSICIITLLATSHTMLKANGHFFTGALSGYLGTDLPVIYYGLTNLYSYVVHRTSWHSQDNIVSFAKGAAIGIGVRMLPVLRKYEYAQTSTLAKLRYQLARYKKQQQEQARPGHVVHEAAANVVQPRSSTVEQGIKITEYNDL